jgi:hypothetical protein
MVALRVNPKRPATERTFVRCSVDAYQLYHDIGLSKFAPLAFG